MTTPSGKNHLPATLRAAASACNMGFAVGVPVFLGIISGNFLDDRFGGHGLILSGMIVLSVLVGLYGAIRSLTKDLPWKR